MIAVRATFDGKQIVLPEGVDPPPVGEVFVMFEEPESSDDQERAVWRQASWESLRKVWDNPHDAIYDDL